MAVELPADVLSVILSVLAVPDLVRAMAVNTVWRDCAQAMPIWDTILAIHRRTKKSPYALASLVTVCNVWLTACPRRLQKRIREHQGGTAYQRVHGELCPVCHVNRAAVYNTAPTRRCCTPCCSLQRRVRSCELASQRARFDLSAAQAALDTCEVLEARAADELLARMEGHVSDTFDH